MNSKRLKFLLVLFMAATALHSVAQHHKKGKTMNWDSVNLAGPDAKLFKHKASYPFGIFNGGMYVRDGSFPAGMDKSIGLTTSHILAHLSNNQALQSKISDDLGGMFTVVSKSIRFKGGEERGAGIELGYFFKPNWEIILQGGYFSTTLKGNFDVAVIQSGQTSTKVLQNEGHLTCDLSGLAYAAGIRYYPKSRYGIFTEFNIGSVQSTIKLSDSKIRNTSLTMDYSNTVNYFTQKLGAGVRIKPFGSRVNMGIGVYETMVFNAKQPPSFGALCHVFIGIRLK